MSNNERNMLNMSQKVKKNIDIQRCVTLNYRFNFVLNSNQFVSSWTFFTVEQNKYANDNHH